MQESSLLQVVCATIVLTLGLSVGGHARGQPSKNLGTSSSVPAPNSVTEREKFDFEKLKFGDGQAAEQERQKLEKAKFDAGQTAETARQALEREKLEAEKTKTT